MFSRKKELSVPREKTRKGETLQESRSTRTEKPGVRKKNREEKASTRERGKIRTKGVYSECICTPNQKHTVYIPEVNRTERLQFVVLRWFLRPNYGRKIEGRRKKREMSLGLQFYRLRVQLSACLSVPTKSISTSRQQESDNVDTPTKNLTPRITSYLKHIAAHLSLSFKQTFSFGLPRDSEELR